MFSKLAERLSNQGGVVGRFVSRTSSTRKKVLANWNEFIFEGLHEGITLPYTDRYARLQRIFNRRPSFPWERAPWRRDPYLLGFVLPLSIVGGVVLFHYNYVTPEENMHVVSNCTLGSLVEVDARLHPRYQFAVPPITSEVNEEVETLPQPFEAEGPLMLEYSFLGTAGRELSYPEVVQKFAQHLSLVAAGEFGPLGKNRSSDVIMTHFANTGIPELASVSAHGVTLAFFPEVFYQPKAAGERDHLMPWARSSVFVRFPDSWSQAQRDCFRRMLEQQAKVLQANLPDAAHNLQPSELRKVAGSPLMAAVLHPPQVTAPRQAFLQKRLLSDVGAHSGLQMEAPDSYARFLAIEGFGEEEKKVEQPLSEAQSRDAIRWLYQSVLKQPSEQVESRLRSVANVAELVEQFYAQQSSQQGSAAASLA